MSNERKFYVYEWYIVDTNEVFYVGKGTGNRLKQISCRNSFFKCMYKTHKCKVRKIYENLTEQEAFKKEIETIKYYKENTNYRLTNQTDGGEGTTGWIPSKEFCDKQSFIQKLQWNDEEYRKKMIRIRNDKNGSYQSQEFRDKISKLVKGENNPNYNNHWSYNQKEELSVKQQNNPLYKNETNPNAKKIICVETGEIFSCIKFAKEKYQINSECSFTVALRNPIRTAGNLHWVEYSEEFLDKEFRFKHLIEALKANSHIKPLICLEDLTIYNSKTDLATKLDVTVAKITWRIKKDNEFKYNNKTYILLKDF